MNQFNDKYKSIAFSSEIENKQYKKVYIVSLYEDDNHAPEKLPYVHIILPTKKFTINKIDYKLPKLIKYLAIFDKKVNKLIVDDNTLNLVNDYVKNLSKIERLLLILRSDLNNMDFYKLRQASYIIDHINIIIFEFESSINYFKNTENTNRLNTIKGLISNITTTISNKIQHFDMLNSRALSIVSLSALPILVLMTIWGSNITYDDSLIGKKNYKLAYLITFITCFILVVFILYIYRKDFY